MSETTPPDPARPPRVRRLVAIVLIAADPGRLARFYRDVLDFVDDDATDDTADDDAVGLLRLRLGDTRLWIEPAAPEAAGYPDDVPGWSPLFQHFALRVADMDAAMARLVGIDGWRPVSTDGPQRLPANTGGVTAFKFRDPEGHPLEFLAFPDRTSGPLFAGIDHTAISVVEVERAVAFYEGLGLVVTGRSLNRGIEQARLDGLVDPVVDVVGLGTAAGTAPHLELLGYRGPVDRDRPDPAAPGDVAATRIVFAADGAKRAPVAVPLQDPDGHRLLITQ